MKVFVVQSLPFASRHVVAVATTLRPLLRNMDRAAKAGKLAFRDRHFVVTWVPLEQVGDHHPCVATISFGRDGKSYLLPDQDLTKAQRLALMEAS